MTPSAVARATGLTSQFASIWIFCDDHLASEATNQSDAPMCGFDGSSFALCSQQEP
jgi:hypothetical protein